MTVPRSLPAGVSSAAPASPFAAAAGRHDAGVRAGRRPAAAASPRRMLAIQTNLGILPQFFWPEGDGMDYKPSPYLEILKDFRREMTVFSGVSHPGRGWRAPGREVVPDGRPAPRQRRVPEQRLAGPGGGRAASARLTRIPVLITRVGVRNCAGSMSYTRGGVEIPPERSVAALYRRMFVQGTAKEVDARLNDLKKGKSVLDFVNDSAKQLQKDLGPNDRDRLDQYFTSVRDLEDRIHESEEWEKKPKPVVKMPEPKDAEMCQLVAASKLMFDMIRLALETDSTRLVTLFISTLGLKTDIPGVEHETHTLTHHGNRPETLAELQADRDGPVPGAGRPARGVEGRQGGRRNAARSDDGALRHLHGQRQRPLERQPAGAARRRRLQARRPAGLRHQEELSAAEPVRDDAAAARAGDRQVRLQHRHDARPGSGLMCQ